MSKIGEAIIDFKSNLANFKSGIAEVKNDLGKFSSSVQSSATQIRQAGVAFTAFGAAITALGTKGVMEYAKFERQMSMVGTMLGEQAKYYMPLYSEAIRKLSVSFGESTGALSKGMYDILSAAIPANEAIYVLEAGARTAKAGFTDTATATNTLISVLNAYHISGKNAGDISDWMFATVKRGVFTFEEFAGAIGKVLPIANMAGVTLEELGAMLATMTRSGLNASEATTSLRGVIMALVKPSKEGAEVIKAMGYENGLTAVKALGLKGVIEKLSQTTEENQIKMFGNVRALTGVMTALNDTAGFTEDLRLITARAGSTNEAFGIATDNLAFKFEQFKEKINEVWRVIGENLIPYVTQAMGIFSKISEAFMNMDASTRQTIIVIGAFLGALSLATGTVMIFVGSLLLLPFGTVIAGIGILIGAFGALDIAMNFSNNRIILWARAVSETIWALLSIIYEPLEAIVETFAYAFDRIGKIMMNPFKAKEYIGEWFDFVKYRAEDVTLKMNDSFDRIARGIAEAYEGARINASSSADSQANTMSELAKKIEALFNKTKQSSKLANEEMGNNALVFAGKQSETIQNISGGFRTFFSGIVQNGKSAFSALGDVAGYAVNLIIQAISTAIAQAIILGKTIRSVASGGTGEGIAGAGINLGGMLAGLGGVLAIGSLISAFAGGEGGGKKVEQVSGGTWNPQVETSKSRSENKLRKDDIMDTIKRAEAERKTTVVGTTPYENLTTYIKDLWNTYNSIPDFDLGAIISEPTVGVIAKNNKPEAVIPLSKMGDMGNKFGDIIVPVNIGSFSSDNPSESLKQIAEAVKKGIPEGIKLAKTIYKIGEKYQGESY